MHCHWCVEVIWLEIDSKFNVLDERVSPPVAMPKDLYIYIYIFWRCLFSRRMTALS